MKKTSLFSIALLLSFGLLAQTSVKNTGSINNNTNIQSNKSGEVNSSTSASSSTSIQTDAVLKAKNKTYAELKKEKESVVATSDKTKTEAKSAAKESKKMTEQDISVSGSAHSSANAGLSKKDNNVSNNTSIISGTSLSASGETTNFHQTKENGKAVGATMVDATMEHEHHIATKVNNSASKTGEKVKAISSAAVHVGANSATTVKPHPVSIRTNTLVKTNGGINLK
ncbi:MAG: hypothetical protein ABI297_01105 [Ginsengibacter sp.]